MENRVFRVKSTRGHPDFRFLASRIRIVNFVVNSKKRLSGELRWAGRWLRRVLLWAGFSYPPLLSD